MMLQHAIWAGYNHATDQADGIGKQPSSQTGPTPYEIAAGLCSLVSSAEQFDELGTFSASIYDTAWVSMIQSKIDNCGKWLFPSAFDYILKAQTDDGTWPRYASLIDGIINTQASLLSLIKHQRCLETQLPEWTFLESRITNACTGLQSLLSSWNVDETDHVAFEVIVPALLHLIEDYGYQFNFEGRKRLMSLYAQKMQKFSPQIAYSKHKSTVLHSLEAFPGLIDYNNVSHHCTELLGICGSPASTAAYLINSSSWDNRAEAYLSNLFNKHSVDGSVPNAFPTCIFELTWACSNLWSPHMNIENISKLPTDQIANLLEQSLRDQHGIVGFARGIVEDADDTARALLTLERFDRKVDLEPMIECFYSQQHFRTYTKERNASFSANCNALLALLESADPIKYEVHIVNVVHYLTQLWNAGPIKDKWNLSGDYSHLLLSETFISLLKRHDRGDLPFISDPMIGVITLILCQILTHSLMHQGAEGGWENDIEVTAYNVLLITQCLSLPLSPEVQDHLNCSIQEGKAFIHLYYKDPTKNHFHWIEKTTYQPRLLKVVYCSSALHCLPRQHPWSESLRNHFSTDFKRDRKIRQLLLSLPRFRQQSIPCIDITLLQAAIYSRRLQTIRDDIIPRNCTPMTKDKYLHFIPTIWLACNSIAPKPLSAGVLWEMIQMSLLNFQVDEYMESVIANIDEASIKLLISAVVDKSNSLSHDENERQIDTHSQTSEQGESNCIAGLSSTNQSTASARPILNYMDWIFQHPAVLHSPPLIRQQVATQLYSFIIAHIEHNFANTQLLGPSNRQLVCDSVVGYKSVRDYFRWVTTMASDDTSCPLSFQFFCCLISQPGTAAFTSVESQYISRSLAHHLATMCRQYNDYGSAERDSEEGNLNSLNFQEFDTTTSSPSIGLEPSNSLPSQVSDSSHKASLVSNENRGQKPSISQLLSQSSSVPRQNDAKKLSLMNIAEFERQCMTNCLKTLESKKLATDATIHAVEVFIDVTDVFGQVYVAKDIASRLIRE